MLACSQGHLAVARMLISLGADFNAQDKQVWSFVALLLEKCCYLLLLCCMDAMLLRKTLTSLALRDSVQFCCFDSGVWIHCIL